MIRLFGAASLVLFSVLLAAAALAATVTDVEVLEYGLYTYDDKVVTLEQGPKGSRLSNIRQLKETLDIPVGEQTFFSIKYILKGNTPNQKVDIELRVTTPKGETSKGSMNALTGVPTTTNIEFTENDTPGTYLLQVLHGDKVLLSKKINLIAP